MNCEKNKVIIGTPVAEAFQISLRNQVLPEDPLNLKTCDDFLGYLSIPHIGVYGHNDYKITPVTALLHLPGLTHAPRTPSYLKDLLTVVCRAPPTSETTLVLVHSAVEFEEAIDPTAREVNLLYHPWLYSGLDFGKEHNGEVRMGVFCHQGVHETGQDIVEELNGAPFERLGCRIVLVHDRRFSPHNCQIALEHNVPVHSFLAVGISADNRLVVSYHLVPGNEEINEQLQACCSKSATVQELISALKHVGPDGCLHHECSIINDLCHASV